MDYTTLLYDPLYAAFGIPAILTPDRPLAVIVAVTVIPQSARADVSQEFELDTVRPSVVVRRNDLEKAGFPIADLDRGLLTYGGRSWRIEAHAVQPGPDGEASGEIILYLSENVDA
ncbi:MAG: hypothetical protein ACU0B9_07275 [Limimaricola soesokkakensis]|uniref:hypothetical protein n=1 Tax=Limimaricola soesokkakensis TaxID=1343159 RepID=UPI0040589C33